MTRTEHVTNPRICGGEFGAEADDLAICGIAFGGKSRDNAYVAAIHRGHQLSDIDAIDFIVTATPDHRSVTIALTR